MTALRPRLLLTTLSRHGVRFVVVGGIAAAMHTVVTATTDLDAVAEDSAENRKRLASALTELRARVKGSPNPPLAIDPELLANVTLMSFETDLGELDVIFEAIGGSRFEQLANEAEHVTVAGNDVLLATRTALIAMKRAAGRPKDLVVADALEVVDEVSHGERDVPDEAPGPPQPHQEIG